LLSSGRKTDDADAYAVAVAGLRGHGLQVVEPDQVRTALKLLSDRRQHLVDQRIMAANRLHRLLTELVPGGADRRLTPEKARQVLSRVRPRDQVGKARKQLALDHAKDVERLDAELRAVKTSISAVVAEHPTRVSDVRRFPSQGPLRQLHRNRTHRRQLRRPEHQEGAAVLTPSP
jgi:transposase